MALIVAAAVSAVLIVVGVGMVSVPAGFITAGVLGLAGAYVAQYLKVRGGAQ